MDEILESKVTVLKNTIVRQLLSMAPYLLIGIVSAFLSGCLSTSGMGTDLEGRIELWVEEQEYGKALAAIDAVDKNDVRYASLQQTRNGVSVYAKEYENKVIKAGKEGVRRNEWGAVLDRYDEALKKLPKSQRLNAEYNNIITLQKIKINQAEQKVLFAKAEMLEKEISYNRELAQVDPRNVGIIKILDSKTQEAIAVSDDLLVFVSIELEKNELNKANRMVSLAYRLHPSDEADALKLRVLESIELQNEIKISVLKKARHKEVEKAKKRAQALISEFNSCLLQDDYSGAMTALNTLKNNSWQPPDLNEREEMLQEKLANYVDRELEVGYSHYKRENYQKALDIWQDALALQPNHKQAKEYVERVQKVIRKLEVLQSKSTD